MNSINTRVAERRRRVFPGWQTWPETGIIGAARRRFAGAFHLVAAAVLVCAGAEAQAQSFYLDDVNLAPNIIRVNAAAGADVSGITPRVISGSTTIQNNVTYSLAGSALFEVNAATGVIRSVGAFTNGNLGHYSMTLTAEHGGETDDFPLTIGVHPVGAFYICDRTNRVRDRILDATPANDVCGSVSETAMAGVTEMNFFGPTSEPPNNTLLDYDFWGMSGLQDLYLTGANLSRLPTDIFAGLDSLNYVIFWGHPDNRIRNQNLTEFPARLIADLERSPTLRFSVNPGDSISGIRYLLDGEAIEGALVLDEGRRYNLEVEVDGGVRDTLTLVFQGRGVRTPFSSLGVTIRPTTITIPPFSNRATVVVEAPDGLSFGERRTNMMAWAWRQFRRDGRFRYNTGNIGPVETMSGRNAEEIRTPDLQVVVRDFGRFEDADPAANQISEAASPGDLVSGWSPQVLVGGNPPTAVSYSLRSNASGLFVIDSATGALSLAPGRMLDYMVSASREVTVDAQVTFPGGEETARLRVRIEITPALFLRDANPVVNSIAATATVGTPVVGVTAAARLGDNTVPRGVMYSLDGPDGLFVVNMASGVISSARPFTDGDIGAHPVTLTAIYNSAALGNLVAILPLTIEVRDGVSICDRTLGVRDEIVRVISSSTKAQYDCNFVPTDALARISTLTMGDRLGATQTLLPGDFGGLPGLEHLDFGNADTVSTLPEDIFEGLSRLENLNLGANRLGALPEGIFADLSNLRVLDLRGSAFLETLPPDIFMNLGRLQRLNLPAVFRFDELSARLLADLEKSPPVALTGGTFARIVGLQYHLDGVPVTESATETGVLTLDEGARYRFQVRVAGGVRSTLTLVYRRDAELPFTVTPQTIEFSPQFDEAVVELMAPPDLDFADSSSTVAWAAWSMFRPEGGRATEIPTRDLRVDVLNTETLLLEDTDPSPNTIAVNTPQGTPVTGVAPVVRVGGVGGTVVPDGVRYALAGSTLFAVHSTSGRISSNNFLGDGALGVHPVTLTATYRNAAASLPLTIGVHPAGGFNICSRTPVVRDEILRRANEGGGTLGCTNVPAANLARIQTLDFSTNPAIVETLRADDFDGLSGLTGLNLRALGLQRLPPDIFRGLSGLANLDLSGNDNLAELPPRLLADLENLPRITAGFDAGVGIGGVQYRLDGEIITGLALDEEASRTFRVEVAGGVHSTLTLVARMDGTPSPIVTPEIIRFSPSSNAGAATFELTAPKDADFENSVSLVSWAWTLFDATGAATEIRTQGLRLDVRELETFEDINPAPNQISEAAAAGAVVSGWSPQVRVDGVIEPAVSYALQPDADPDFNNLFRIDSVTGALSLIADRTLDSAMFSNHEVTVVAEVTDSGVTATLTVTIEVTGGFVLRDAEAALNIIAAPVARGTPVGGLAVSARNGATALSGVVYSLVGPDFLEISRTSGRVSAARPIRVGNIGSYPVTITAVHSLGMLSLPLTIEVRGGISICNRTRQIRDAIVELIDDLRDDDVTYTCDAVPPNDLASIGTLTVPSQDLAEVTGLLENDFDGMPALGNLDLSGIAASSLPEGIFSGLPNLRVLNLAGSSLLSLPSGIFNNSRQLEDLNLSFSRVESLPQGVFRGLSSLRILDLTSSLLTSLPRNIFTDTTDLRVLNMAGSSLTSLPPDILMNLGRLERLDLSVTPLTELPARLLANLEKPTTFTGGFDTGVLIGGIQYRLDDGTTTSALTLNEGGSHNLQVEAVGGVSGTLTLVFRSGAGSRFTATPETIRLTASRSAAAVTLEVPADLNAGDRSGPAQWAWEMFSGVQLGADELRTPGLQVSVRDTHRFEDAEPAANRISETAMPGDLVSGWSPQVVVDGNPVADVSYRLSSDAGGLFAINAATGALLLAPGQVLDYTTSPTHQVTVIARVTASGATASLAAAIEVDPVVFLTDTNPLANIIPVPVPAGLPAQGVAPAARLGGDLLTDGVTYTLTGSGLFTVNPVSGVISAAQELTEGNTGDYPVTLTATHPRGLPGSLPLTIEVFRGVSVCERTPVIEDEIIRLLNSGREQTYSCNFVPPHRLASITTLNLSGRLDGSTSTTVDDFAGMTGLEYLDLGSLGAVASNPVSLPDGIFRDLLSLRVLNLRNSRLTPLPPRLLANLERPPRVIAGFDAAARIGGIEYLVDGTTIKGPVTLNEGDSLSLQIRAVGGVRSTLTLAFRADGVPITASPAAIEFGPFSNTNTAVVELTAQPSPDFANSSGQVFHAWEMFDAAAGGTAEIRAAQSLRVDVRVTQNISFEDDDLAPNTIAVSAATGTNVAGVMPTVRVGVAVVTTGVEYSLAGSPLFAASSTSGAIFSTRLLTDSDRGNHPVTLTASYRGGTDGLPLIIGVHPAGGFDICDRTPLVQREILRRVNAGGSSHECGNIPAVSLASVQTLDFSGYSTTAETLLAYDFDGLSGLTNLNLASLGLRNLPPGIFSGLTNLSSLSLSANDLTSLPPGIFSGLTNLSSLSLSANDLTSLPPGIFSGLSNLSSLFLSGNDLTSLSPGIFSGLTNLSSLSLGGNDLTSLPPDVFSGLSNLSSLFLGGNGLASLSPGIFSGLTNLSSLSLGGNDLTSLPRDVFSGLSSLQVLDFEGNANLVLPAQAVADLEKTPRVAASFDADARIGIEHYSLSCNGRPSREPVTELALNAGDRRTLRLEGVGGFRGSTLTLALRTEGASPPTVTPGTIRFEPLSGFDAVLIELTASPGSVAWAWTMFNAFGEATELRTPSLRVDVPERNSLEDANPAPNQIRETAAAGDFVSGWRPRVVVRGAIETAVRYSLQSDAGGLFRIHAASGGLSLVSEGSLDYTRSTSHQVTVAAEATACDASVSTLTQMVVIEVIPFALSDADPSTNTIAANAATGTRVEGITPVVRTGDTVLTDGAMYSLAGPDLFAVNTASGVISAARQFMASNAGVYPVTLTAIYQGTSASLPLAIEVFPAVSICDRTLEVRDEILRVLSRSAVAAYTCDAVPPADLASISTLNVPRQRRDVPTLLANDFDGMPALSTLTLAGLSLTSLPEGIFRNTTNLHTLNLAENNLASLPENIFSNLGRLEVLNLTSLAATGLPEAVFSGLPNLRELVLLESSLTSLPPGIFRNLGMLRRLELSLSNDLTELPAPLLADLEKIVPPVFLGIDTEGSLRFGALEARLHIGGIRYRLDGAATTALTVNEGESRNLQVEAVGDIRSTLTLVFRTDAASRLTATPATIRLTPSQRTTAVALTALPDLNTGDRSGQASWAWTNLAGSGAELRLPDLQVSVRDTHRFDDTDPAPNRIGETAPAGVAVSGWSPQVLVGGVAETAVSYRLSSDAGGVFEIDTASGVLSLAPGQVLSHATTPTHEITVVAQAPSGATASLAATIEVFTLALEDADPAPNTIAATAPPGTPVSGVQPVLLVDGAAVADGVFYTLAGSGLFTVATASGLISSAGALGGGGVHPVTLTAAYLGAPADLPLTIIVRAAAGFDICGRTPVVQEEILYRVNTLTEVRSLGDQYGCAAVPTTWMASVRRLDFSRYSTTVETMRVDDFDGLSGLTSLNLRTLGLRSLPPGIFSGLTNLSNLTLASNNLASLPPGIFSGLFNLSYLLLGGNNLASLPPDIFSDLSNLSDLFLEHNNLASLPPGIFSAQARLTSLSLSENGLTSLPPDVFSGLTSLRFLELEGNANLVLPAQAAADLERTPRVTAVFDAGARIGGLRFHAPQDSSFFGNVLPLEEGSRLNLRIEAIGGVRSTLTLALRLDNDAPQFTVAPTTVRFSPLSNTDTAVVELAVPADETIDPANTGMSWAWTMFGGQPFAATEIRTQFSLEVIVNDNSGLVDTDPADNRISEAAFPGDLVSGWSPQLVVDRVTETAVRYRLSQDAGGLFQIHPVSGTLSLASGRLLNYRNSPAHTVRVVARASGGEWPLTTTISVDNVEELSLSGAVAGSIPETAATGTVVSGLGVSLLDEGVPVPGLGGVVWSLSGAGSQVFQPGVRGSVAVLELVGALDYETTPAYTLALRAAYQRESATTQITVRVLDAAESLTLEAAGPYQIGEDALPDTLVGSVRTIDETGTPLTGGLRYTATGDGKFTVTNAGDILVAGQLDYEASTSHTLFITASQGRLVSNQLRVDIAVLDIANDLQLVDQSSAENIASNTTGGQVRGLNLVFQVDGVNQAGAASAWRLLPEDAGLFDINSATGAITLRRVLAVVPANYRISVAATWTGGDGVSREAPPLPLNVEVNDGIPVRIRVFLEGAVIP